MKLIYLFLYKVHFPQREKSENATTSQGVLATATLIPEASGQFQVGEQRTRIFFKQTLLDLIDL